MDTLGFISKEKPVYLYKIIRSDASNAPIISYKEFVVVKAWSSEGNDICKEGRRFFDYYYNGRIHRKQEVGLNEFLPFITSTGFNIWSYNRDDEYAIQECKKWIISRANKFKSDLNVRATRLMADRDFCSRLEVVSKDGVDE